MSAKSVAAIVGLVACVSCAPQTPEPATPAGPAGPAPVATTVSAPPPAPAAAPVNAVPSNKNLGVIIGTVVTEPWRSIKNGAVVYLEDAPKEAGVGMNATIDNHDMTFVPFITVITAGGTVKFGNTDPITHNAFSADGEGWDVGSIPSHGFVPHTFDKSNVYSVLCNLHKTMLAYVVVSPSSYFTRTNPDGSYALNAPPGTWKVTAWSPRLKPTTKVVTVTPSEVTVNFELTR